MRVRNWASLVALTLWSWTSLVTPLAHAETPEQANTIGRRLGAIDQASTFIELLKNTDQTKNLLFATNATTTVFVPTNKAFEGLDAKKRAALLDPANKHYLERVLTYHALHKQRIDRYILTQVGLVKNGEGQFLTVRRDGDGHVTVDGAKVSEYDLVCSNGVVHFIDQVLEPVEYDLFESLERDGRFTVLCQLIKRSGLTKLFQNRHDLYTIFAPTDDAFAQLPAGTVEMLMSPEKLDLLSDVIRAHIVSTVRTVEKIPGEMPLGTPGLNVYNEYGQELVYRLLDGQPTIDGVSIVEADQVARNGFFHVVDRPLTTKRDSIITVLERQGNYNQFLSLVREAGLYDLLGQFREQVTVFAPMDEAFQTDAMKVALSELKRPSSRERLRGLLQRHIVNGRILMTNAIGYRRFNSRLNARVDLTRAGEERAVQGVEIVETDLLARNGVVHGIAGLIPEDMEQPDQDQTWMNFRKFITQTIDQGSALYSAGKFQDATEYYARRGYEFKARYEPNLYRFYKINADKVLNDDVRRNRHYDFASTTWVQRNKFLELQRQLEQKQPLQIDELELGRSMGRELAASKPQP